MAETCTSAPEHRSARRLGDVSRPSTCTGASGAEHPAKITTAVAPVNGVADAVPIADVGALESELTDLPKRLDKIGMRGSRLDDPDPNTALERDIRRRSGR